MITEFYKDKLNPGNRIVYEGLLNDFSSLRQISDIGNASVEDAFPLYKALYNDHAELFYLTPFPQLLQQTGFSGVKKFLQSKHIYSDKEIMRYKKGMSDVFENIKNITRHLTDEAGIEAAVCDYFIENIRYEVNNTLNQNSGTVLCDGKGQCSGIAKAIKYIFDGLGIYCVVVDGTSIGGPGGKTAAHTWNIVKIGGHCHHLDVTAMIGGNPDKKKPYHYCYFNENDEGMRCSHVWDRDFYPRCDTQSGNMRGDGSRQNGAGKGNARICPDEGEVINSYWEFGKKVKLMYEKRAAGFSFVSGIPEKNSDLLADRLVNQLNREAVQRNLALSISVNITGKSVTVRLDWEA